MEHAGARLGRVWRALRTREKQLIRWLVVRGCPAAVAYSLIWIIRFAIFGLMLYTSVIVALIVLAALIIGNLVSRASLSNRYEEPEWRYGLLGFGLYERDGTRVDPHDPNDPHANT
jgi:hypothetical protein